MSIRTQMFEKDEMLAVIFKTSLELYKNALQRCEAGIVLYGSQYEIDICWFRARFRILSRSLKCMIILICAHAAKIMLYIRDLLRILKQCLAIHVEAQKKNGALRL